MAEPMQRKETAMIEPFGFTVEREAVTRIGFACPCGDPWLLHEALDGDGSDLCCLERCDQVACPGSQNKIVLSGRWTEPTSTER